MARASLCDSTECFNALINRGERHRIQHEQVNGFVRKLGFVRRVLTPLALTALLDEELAKTAITALACGAPVEVVSEPPL